MTHEKRAGVSAFSRALHAIDDGAQRSHKYDTKLLIPACRCGTVKRKGFSKVSAMIFRIEKHLHRNDLLLWACGRVRRNGVK